MASAEICLIKLPSYEYMAEQMDAADEVYAPFSQLLSEQAIFMSRDLSPEAMALLQPMSEELNSMAQALYAGFEAILEGPPPPDEAVAETTEELVEPSSLEEVVEEGAASDQP